MVQRGIKNLLWSTRNRRNRTAAGDKNRSGRPASLMCILSVSEKMPS